MPHATTPLARTMPLRLTVWTRRTGPAGSRVGRVLASRAVSAAARARAVDEAVAQALRPGALPALRLLLGLLFVWFGALKVIGRSPVAGLVAQTLPFADPRLVLPVLGVTELALGILLMSGAFVRVALPALAMHLAGTFSTFVVAHDLMFSEGNPLLLTANGEFVAKNLVLIAATLALIAHTSRTVEPSSCTHDVGVSSGADLTPVDI